MMSFIDIFRPRWDHSDGTEAGRAVKSISNQMLLAKIAKKARTEQARSSAVENLTDQALLAEITKTDGEASVRARAVAKLTNQAVLAEVAKADKDGSVRRTAAERLNDQEVLADVAMNASDDVCACLALERLNNKPVIAEAAMRAASDLVRHIATYKVLTDKLGSDVGSVFVEGLTEVVSRGNIEREGDYPLKAMREAIRIRSRVPVVEFYAPGVVIRNPQSFVDAREELISRAKSGTLLDDVRHAGELIISFSIVSDREGMNNLMGDIYKAASNSSGNAFQLIYNELQLAAAYRRRQEEASQRILSLLQAAQDEHREALRQEEASRRAPDEH
jgi:hypothetical protein